MPTPSNQEEVLFALALEKPADRRPALLDAMCEGNPALRQRLEALLAAHGEPDDSLPEPAPAVAATIKLDLPEVPDEAVGQTLGRYKLLERLGEGGCGVVYVAEQTQPVRRRVALKVIKLGMDTKAVVARFEAERQALAMMDHPNIAKVLDAGTTETGRPFFVMELVRGIRITEYCDQSQLTTTDRIDLFIKICHAIQHAHQKGIIHRDIKPSNILVTLHDGVPVPKVIDFGIAKATEGRLTDATVYTQLHQFIGTPAYMSPEQAEMSGLDIDTRSDIYSLGVLLYELLAGSTPFDPNELMSRGIDMMRKTIREKEPMRPSTRFATLKGEELTTTAKRRSADSSKLAHQLKGDLDWIVMKCLEKDRTRRYETANGLAADLKRHLNNEPIVARPPSAAYRFQKAFRRNKLVYVAGLLVAAALLLGIIASTWQAVRARRAEALALQSRGDAEKLSNFMLDDFYAELEPSGQFETVAGLAKRAVAYYDGLPAPLRTPETARNRAMALARLALVTARQGDVKTALPIAEEVVATLEPLRRQGDQSDATIFALGLAYEAEFSAHMVQVDFPSGADSLRRGAEILGPIAVSADGSRRVKLEYANLLNELSHEQQPEQGMTTCEEALHILAGLGALDWSDLSAASAWADVADSEAREALELGQLDDAERLEKQVGTLGAGVLARRPGDLRAKLDLFYSSDVLSQVAMKRFDEEGALQLATQARQAAEEYLRFNPSDSLGWQSLLSADGRIANLLYHQGRIAEMVRRTRAAAQTDENHASMGLPAGLLWQVIAEVEAQRGNRDAADQAFQKARRSFDALRSAARTSKILSDFWTEELNGTDCRIQLAAGEDATAYARATQALPHLDKLLEQTSDSFVTNLILWVQHTTLETAARAALNLGHFADAESAAVSLVTSPASLQDGPDEAVWGQVLRAQAVNAQSRPAEALKILQPALAKYQSLQAQGAAYLTFQQHFARALYVQAMAEPSDAAGTVRRQAELARANTLLQGFSEEGRQLYDTQELQSWINAAQQNPKAATPVILP